MWVLALFFINICYGGEELILSARDPAWLALLHYESKRSSTLPGPPFFLSDRGHKDPQAELESTVSLFEKNPEEAHCRFPAREMFLRRQLLWNGPVPNCERLDKWKAAFSAKGIELIFASAFINSPSSMYGHTLLKFPRSGITEGNDLLDYTLSYGADTGTTGGLAYVWKGLTGGFQGLFTSAPFYMKVKEYNHVDKRDFWIYPLRVLPGELEVLVNLGNS